MSFLKSFLQPCSTEGLQRQLPDTKAVLNGKGLGTSTLCITESHLTWSNGSGLGFWTEYPNISLHVVSRDLNVYPQEHLYVWVNAKCAEESKESVGGRGRGGGGGGREGSDDDIEPIAQFRFMFSDKSALEAMFTAMCEYQAFHPDPEDEDSSDFHGEGYDAKAHEQGQGDVPPCYICEAGLPC